MTRVRTRVLVGDRFRVRLGYSEVCVQMGVAGRVMTAELVGNSAVQLLDDNDRWFSAPITIGDAGVAVDDDGTHRVYAVAGDSDR